MRSKEEAHDYRYFPEPDLPPLVVTDEFIARVRAEMPELPSARRQRFMDQYGLAFNDAAQLTTDRALADYFERAAQAANNARAAANWVRTELLRELEASKTEVESCPITPENLGALIRLIDQGRISGKQGKEVFAEMFATGKSAEEIVRQRGLEQVSDVAEIERLVEQAIAANPKQVEQYRAGKEGLLGFFVGQVMKASQGRANPKIVNELLRAKLNG